MSAFSSSDYRIERHSGVCAETGRKIEPGETYIALVVEDGESLARIDLSLEAWEAYADNSAERCFGYWRAVAPQPDEKPKVFVDDTVLLELLKRLDDAAQSQRVAFRFVLMLILMRKKLLRYDKTERSTGADGQTREWWVLTPKADPTKGPLGRWAEDETIKVLDPHLDEEGIRAVTEQLGEILNAEL